MKINKIFVNGSVVNVKGNNVTIVNGRVISGEETKGETKKFDLIRTEDVNNVEAITIDSEFVNVCITGTKSSNIELNLYGEAEVDGKLDLDVERIHRELKISVNAQGNFFNSNLQLDIALPPKKFESITINGVSADVDIYNEASAKVLKVKTVSGDIGSTAIFERGYVETKSGDINLRIKAESDFNVEVNTVSGNVNLHLTNIEDLNIHKYSISGDFRNHCRSQSGYTANVDITTISGDITIW